MRAVRMVAWREFGDSLHSLWLIGFGILFALLTAGISYYGLASAKAIGFQGFDLVSTSLLNLVLFIVPLVALAQASLSLLREADDLPILLTQSVDRWQVLVGRILGLAAAIALTLEGGLLLGGAIVLSQAGSENAGQFLLLMLLALVLIAVFAAVGAVVATVWRERARALGISLSIWFVLVILYDLVVFGMAVAGTGLPLRALLLTALALNPVDAARVTYLLASDNQAFVGATGAVMADTLGSPLGMAGLGVLLALWLGVSLTAAWRVFERRDF